MRYKLLAPVRTDFSIVSEAPIRDPDGYAAFWDAVAENKRALRARLADGSALSQSLREIRFPHASAYRRRPSNRYQSLESDALERPVHALEVDLGRSAVADRIPSDGASRIAELGRRVDRVVWRVFDHGISLLEVEICLGDVLHTTTPDRVPAALNDVQRAGVMLGERIAREDTTALLQPLFDWLHTRPGSADVLESDATPRGHHAHGTVLWVTRTLVFEPGDAPNRAAIIRHWLKDAGPAGRAHATLPPEEAPNTEPLIDRIVRDDEAHLTRWLNYLFREGAYAADAHRAADPDPEPSNPRTRPELATPFCDAWEAMLHAQFFYGALDIVDLHLTRILAQSLARDSSLKVDELKALLEQNIRKANLLLLQFHDNAKYYKRTVKAELDDILGYWDFEEVLIGPVQEKITLCQERLTLLHQKEAARSAIYTDIILLGIGITSIFGTSLALAEYGRTMATDADLGSYDVTRTPFIDWFAALPTDVILVGASILSLLLVVLYAYYRKQQTL